MSNSTNVNDLHDESELDSGPCAALVVFDSKSNAESFQLRLHGRVISQGAGHEIHVGSVEEKQIAVVASSKPPRAIAALLEILVSVHKPKLIISAGDAMGISSNLEIGKLFIASEVVQVLRNVNAEDDNDCIHLNVTESMRTHVATGRLISRPEVDPKKRILSPPLSIAGDAEDERGFSIAAFCRESGIPLLVLRSITESRQEEVPQDIKNYISQKSLVGKMGALTGAAWRKPSQLKTLWKKKERAFDAGDRLSAFLYRFFES